MKKYLKAFLMAFILIPSLFLFSACGGKNTPPTDLRENLTEQHISLSAYQFEYDGKSKTPTVTVTVNENVITSNNYTVSFSDNIEIGTASVTVTAFDASTLIKGSATKTFQIVERVISVSTFDELVAAISNDEHNIVLSNDIEYSSNDPILNLVADEKSIDLTLNFDGHKFERNIRISNLYIDPELGARFYDNSISLTLYNGNVGSSSDLNGYGISVLGNENVSVRLNNIDSVGYYAGLSTNGLCSNSSIEATDCSFTAGNSKELGAYLPANYTYTFNDCIFEGDTAIYIKAGNTTFNNCELFANGESKQPVFSNNGCEPTGSTVVIESNTAYLSSEIIVTFIDCNISSENNFGVHAFISVGEANSFTPITVNFEGTVVIISNDNILSEADGLPENAITFNGLDNLTNEPPQEDNIEKND